MVEIKLTPMAHQDIENIYTFISKDGENIAFKQIQLIFKSLEHLKDFPKMGKDISNILKTKHKYRSLS
ncbi:MAG: type II toxin-antitoxin system RelE/ParE family toxin [Roseburia sp.]|nr:type II toxin-antitoxin system RelE/ParE family toxin [Roseburia sp.]MCM1557144.1 type II toxin-antitoxin system RelE/ParE family toxin [Anaeroplasma bactoclasticum]